VMDEAQDALEAVVSGKVAAPVARPQEPVGATPIPEVVAPVSLAVPEPLPVVEEIEAAPAVEEIAPPPPAPKPKPAPKAAPKPAPVEAADTLPPPEDTPILAVALRLDPLLDQVDAGITRPALEQMPKVIERLLPLLRLLAPNQRAWLAQWLGKGVAKGG
jgi:two-component system, cell cycle response regulator